MDIRHWLKQAVATLCGGDSPKRDAEILLGFVTGKSRSWLVAFDETLLTEAQLQQLDVLLARRARGEPVAHLIGEREFWSLPLQVNDATLIPRPDTEILVEQALAHLPESPARVLDMGTGSGAIALPIASDRPDCDVIGLDRIRVTYTFRNLTDQDVTGEVIFPLPPISLQALMTSDFNIPEGGLVLILAVDHFLDMGRAATNVVGNAVATSVIARWEGKLQPPWPADMEVPHAPSHSIHQGARGLNLDPDMVEDQRKG